MTPIRRRLQPPFLSPSYLPKYKCRPTVTIAITAIVTVTVTATVTSTTVTKTCPTNHYLIHETRSTLIHMQLMPRSPREYLKPYAQQHQHMPLPSMYQDHHIPSQDMCLNQVPTCTMYQPCIDLYLNLYHQPCTTICTTTSASTMHQHLYQTMHQPCTSTCTKPCINHAPQHHTKYHTMFQQRTSTMYINTIPCTNPVPYHVSTMHQPCTITSVSTIYHVIPYTIFQ
jgi:hypothetical protein